MRSRLRDYGKRSLAGAAGLLLLLVAAFFALDRLSPLQLDRYHNTSDEMLSSDGRLMRLFTVEDGLVRRQVSLEEVDPLFIRMLVAYEDKRFLEHSGVDMLALVRALAQAAWHGEVVSGASTLTMQAERLLEPRPRTLRSKVIEMFRAWQLEYHFSKEDILEIYLTLAPYGGNIEGIKAAAFSYFGQEAAELSPDQAALLVILPQAPTRLRPDRYAARATLARNKVLNRVADDIGLDARITALALAAPVPAVRQEVDMVAPHLAARLVLAGHGGRTQTTIDRDMQAELERLVGVRLAAVHDRASAAVLVVHNRSRRVLAYVGSAGFGDRARRGYVDMVTATRSPGSTLKPFIYGMAIEHGLAHAETRMRDEPRSFGGYAPGNFMDRHYGEVSMREALVRSLNVPAVAALERLGPVAFTETLREAGVRLRLPGDEPAGLAVALGGVGTSLESLVEMYAALADDGVVRPLVYLRDDPGAIPPAGEILSAATRRTVGNMLAGVRPPEDRLPPDYQNRRRAVAYKTGTSYGFRDMWAIGYDGDYTVGVWIGRPDGTPLPGHFGASTAAPVLFDVFDRLPASVPGDWARAPGDRRGYAELPPALKYFDRPERLMLAGAGVSRLGISFPLDGSVVELAQENMRLSLQADGGARPLQWFVDGKPIPTSRWAQQASFTLRGEGFYQVTVMDAGGQVASSTIRVVAPVMSR
jgi:penicillin-binding protein 1C